MFKVYSKTNSIFQARNHVANVFFGKCTDVFVRSEQCKAQCRFCVYTEEAGILPLGMGLGANRLYNASHCEQGK